MPIQISELCARCKRVHNASAWSRDQRSGTYSCLPAPLISVAPEPKKPKGKPKPEEKKD